jgi:hypothetical protein
VCVCGGEVVGSVCVQLFSFVCMNAFTEWKGPVVKVCSPHRRLFFLALLPLMEWIPVLFPLFTTQVDLNKRNEHLSEIDSIRPEFIRGTQNCGAASVKSLFVRL